MAENNILKDLERELFQSKLGLIDSSNCILYIGLNNYFQLINLIESYKPLKLIQITDASTPHIVKKKFGEKDSNVFKKLIKNQTIKLAPAKTQTDIFLIQLAIDNPGHFVLSNDKFANYALKYTSSLNLIKFMQLNSKFYFNLSLIDGVSKIQKGKVVKY